MHMYFANYDPYDQFTTTQKQLDTRIKYVHVGIPIVQDVNNASVHLVLRYLVLEPELEQGYNVLHPG